MSGICAIYRPGGDPADDGELDAMLVAGAHRASDGVERRREGPISLGHLAQLTVDHRATALGATPDFTLSITADCRLDRGSEIEAPLRARDLLPRDEPATDADILLAAYRLWGHRCVPRLRGDFAFVLWDRERRMLLAARDRLGIKPLCYANVGGAWFFASEAQQIAALPAVGRELERRTIARYLAHCLPSDDLTPFRRVHQLEPGHWMAVSERGDPRIERYWSPGSTTWEDPTAEELLRVLRDAVDRRLRRPSGGVGLLMSGGLDSCSVAAIAHETLGPELHPVTHAFEKLASCDERAYTEAMREKFGLRVSYNWPEEQSLFPAAAEHPDPEDPFLGWSEVHRRPLETLQTAGTRVVLTGHGGDSVIGGSPLVYSDQLRSGRITALVRDLHRHARERDVPLRSLIHHYILTPRFPWLSGERVRRLLGRPPLSAIPSWIRPEVIEQTGLREDFERFYDPASWGRTARDQIRSAVLSTGSVGRAVGLFDRLGHRHRLDVRHPFLDADLVDYVLSLPPEALYSGGESKLPLRRRLTELPTTVRTRRQKTSFRAYTDHRLRGDDRDRLRELLCPSIALSALNFVDPGSLSRSVDRYLDGSDAAHGGVIFFTASIESWLRTYPPSP